jgi:S1-C subfamily serine protease
MKIFLLGFVILGMLFSLQAEIVPFLGVATTDIVHSNYAKYEITDGYGILIKNIVKDTQAKKAGLQKGMIIRTYQGEKVYTREQLSRQIRNSSIGEKVKLVVMDKGKEQTFNITLGEKEYSEPKKSAWMGVTLEDDFELEGFTGNYGVQITSVSEDSPAEKAGLLEDDVMLSLQDEKLYSQDQVRPMLRLYEPEDQVKIAYWRAGKEDDTILTLGELSFDLINMREIDNLFDNLNIPEKLEDVYGIWNSLGLPEALHVFAFQDSSSKILGVIVSDLDEKVLQKAGISDGIRVDKVISDTPAALGGILAEDIILKINDRIVADFDDIGEILQDVEFGQEFTVNILRDAKMQDLKLTMQKVTDEIWSKYYSDTLENDVFKAFNKNNPIDFYYENLDDLDEKIDHEIEIEWFKSDNGPM